MARDQTLPPLVPIEKMLEQANAEFFNAPPPAEPLIRTDLTNEEWNALADTKLQELLQTAQGVLLLAAIKESKDRTQGKAMPAAFGPVDSGSPLRDILASLEGKTADLPTPQTMENDLE